MTGYFSHFGGGGFRGGIKKSVEKINTFFEASLRHLLQLFLELKQAKGLKVAKEVQMACRLDGH